MANGHVRWFSKTRGFGFILDEGFDDVYVHHTAICGDGTRSLEKGQAVEFDVMQGLNGDQADNVLKRSV